VRDVAQRPVLVRVEAVGAIKAVYFRFFSQSVARGEGVCVMVAQRPVSVKVEADGTIKAVYFPFSPQSVGSREDVCVMGRSAQYSM
jgi:hypothetical protein